VTGPSDVAGPFARSAGGAAPNETMVYCRRARDGLGHAGARLLVRSGAGAGTVVPLSGEETCLGRGRDNDVVLPDISVSRRHALLRREGGGYLLVDQGSGNGTRVNGRPVEQARLRSGDRILLGDAVVEFLGVADVAVHGRAAGVSMPRSWTRTRITVAWAALPAVLLAATAVVVGPAAHRGGRGAGPARRSVLTRPEPLQSPIDDPPPLDAVAAQRETRDAWSVHPKQRPSGASLVAALPAIGAAPRPAIRKRAASEAAAAAIEAYSSGDLDAAIAQARAAREEGGSGEMLASLERLSAARGEGMALMEQDRTREAIEALERADVEDRFLAKGRDGPLGREIRRALSLLHARAAASLDPEAEVGAAAAHLRAAVELDAGNERAREQLRQVAARAGDRYLRGYIGKDSDPAAAREQFRWVVAALPASDETALKARRWLDRLDGRAPAED